MLSESLAAYATPVSLLSTFRESSFEDGDVSAVFKSGSNKIGGEVYDSMGAVFVDCRADHDY
jgi:hypothetical protein